LAGRFDEAPRFEVSDRRARVSLAVVVDDRVVSVRLLVTATFMLTVHPEPFPAFDRVGDESAGRADYPGATAAFVLLRAVFSEVRHQAKRIHDELDDLEADMFSRATGHSSDSSQFSGQDRPAPPHLPPLPRPRRRLRGRQPIEHSRPDDTERDIVRDHAACRLSGGPRGVLDGSARRARCARRRW
jgi:hypothetical protein